MKIESAQRGQIISFMT